MKNISIPFSKKLPLLLIILVIILIAVGAATGELRTGYKSAMTMATHTRAWWDSLGVGVKIPVTPVQSKTSEYDKMPQVYVPAGEFVMGIQDYAYPSSKPVHTVWLDAFWVDQYEVSNEQFALCVNAKQCRTPSLKVNKHYFDPTYANYPVVYIRWQDAVDYCQWAQRTLPTEAQWEKAARGTDGRMYPWGNEQPDTRRANYENTFDGPLPVDRYPLGASPYGAFNMAGNVREWVADWFAGDYYRISPDKNPTGPLEGNDRSLRGGSYVDSARQLVTYNRFLHEPMSPGINRGFRCVELEKPTP
jgi:formylglycine-generating enzyme required for sulfatase activity